MDSDRGEPSGGAEYDRLKNLSDVDLDNEVLAALHQAVQSVVQRMDNVRKSASRTRDLALANIEQLHTVERELAQANRVTGAENDAKLAALHMVDRQRLIINELRAELRKLGKRVAARKAAKKPRHTRRSKKR